MATRKPASRSASSRARSAPSGAGPSKGSSFGPFLLGVLLALAGGAAVWTYLHPAPHKLQAVIQPAASGDPMLPVPAAPTPPPAKPAPPEPPFSISEDVFEAGARQYAKSCASCHGTPAHPSVVSAAEANSPAAAQFFRAHANATRSPSKLFLATKYGLPDAPSMPAYAHTLTDIQIWQLALLLSDSGKPLPLPVTKILNAPAKATGR